MKQLNRPISRARRARSVARIVFLITTVAGVACFAASGVVTSRASRKIVITTGPNATAQGPCTTDPIVINNSDSGAGSLRQAIADACEASTITFDMALVTSPISLTTAQLSISKNLTITGPGSNELTVQRSTAEGTSDFRIFRITSGNIVSISGLTISNGRDAVDESLGGGIFNELSTLNVSACTFSGNRAVHGGGIYNNLGELNVTNSTFSENSSTTGSGGGISNDHTLNVVNSTFSGNSGGTSGGGGIMNLGTATITNSTLTGNSAGSGGGVANVSAGQTNLRNSIIALNTSNCGGACTDGGSPDLFGSNFTSLGHNIVGSTDSATISAQTGDKFNAAASPIGLGPLANNGGATQTHALLADSTAIDAGDNCVIDDSCSPLLGLSLTTDQRGTGFRRNADSADANTTQTVDIGAFEAHASVEDIGDKSTAEDTPLSFDFNVGDGATITDVSALSGNATVVPSDPANISVTGSGSIRTLNITPAANQNSSTSGSVTITVTVTAGTEVATDTFVLTVTSVNDAPFGIDASFTTLQNVAYVFKASDFYMADENDIPPNTLLGVKITSLPGLGSLTNKNVAVSAGDFISQADISAGELKFTPALNATGTPYTSLTFQVQDNGGTDNGGVDLDSTPNTIWIHVEPKGNQTITVHTHAPASATYNSQFTVAASASSGLAVSYSSSGACTNSGATFTMTSGTGTCTVKYDQDGSSEYNAAPQVTESVTAQKANQTITFNASVVITFGVADFNVSATASSGLPVSFTASGQCTVTMTLVHLTGAGSCTITATQGGDSNYNAAPNVPQLFLK